MQARRALSPLEPRHIPTLSTTRIRDVGNIIAEKSPIQVSDATPPDEAIISEVESLYDLFAKDQSPIKIAAIASNPQSFAIAHMMSTMVTRGLLDGSASEIANVLDHAKKYIQSKIPRTAITRYRMLQAMRAIEAFDTKRPDKECRPASTAPALRDIALLVQESTGISFEEIKSQSRSSPIVKARFQAIWLMRKVCGQSLNAVGTSVGGRDHTTILSAVNKMALQIEQDKGYRDSIDRLSEKADNLGHLRYHRMAVSGNLASAL